MASGQPAASWWDASVPSTVNSVLSTISAGRFSSSSLRPIAEALGAQGLADEDAVSTALSAFVLEACTKQLQQYHASTLNANAQILNRGEGQDYSVDVTKGSRGELVVVKHCKNNSGDTPWNGAGRSPECSRIWKVLKEIQIMTHPLVAQCPYVLSIQGFGWDYMEGKTTTPSLIVEYATKGTLRQYLRSSAAKTDAQKLDVTLGLCGGIRCLHQCGIIHGDIKMENILIAMDKDGRVVPKIADFGSSIIMAPGEAFQMYSGTDVYNPPEVRRLGGGQGGVLIAREELIYCDVYAFGLLVIEAILDGKSYVNDEIAAILEGTSMGDRRLSCLRQFDNSTLNPSEVRSRFRTLISQALCERPSERRNFDWIMVALSPGTDTTSQTGIESEQLDLQISPSSAIIDLSHSITLRAVLKGRGVATFSPEKLPWSVQTEIVKRYQNLAQLEDPVVSGFAHLNLAVCHYLGLGVERDNSEICQHIHASASRRTPEARLILPQLSAALDFPVDTAQLDGIYDAAFDDDLVILASVAGKAGFRTPFAELLKRRFASLPTISIPVPDLHTTAVLNDYETVKRLIDQGTKDSPNTEGKTALLLACQNGHFEVATLLLEKGSDPSIADRDGYTPLHMLVMFPDNHINQICDLMYESNKSIDTEASSSSPLPLPDFWDELIGTPLQWAVTACNLAAVKALIAIGASPDTATVGLNPIQLASSLYLHDILDVLIGAAQEYAPDPQQNGIFYLNETHPFRPIMIHGGTLSIAIEKTIGLLCNTRRVGSMTAFGITPLMKIAFTNISSTDLLITRELLKHCDTSIEGANFSTIEAGILGCNGAPSKSLCELTLLLIEAGFWTRAVSSEETSWPGWNAMHWAAAGQNLSIVQALFDRDPELLHIPTEYETKDLPLHIAAQASYGLETTRLLLHLGADPCAQAGYGQTALANCIGDWRLELDMEQVSLLLDANAANGYVVQVSSRSTILSFATLRAAHLDLEGLRGWEFLEWLLQRAAIKALVNTLDGHGNTPLHIACAWCDPAAIRHLVTADADATIPTPDGVLSPLGIVLEKARAPERGWAGRSLDAIWFESAYRAACFLSDHLAGSPTDKRLSRLHIAAYCGCVAEVKRLVEGEGASLDARSKRGQTALEMLAAMILQYIERRLDIHPGYLQRAREIMVYLTARATRPESAGEAS